MKNETNTVFDTAEAPREHALISFGGRRELR